MATNNSYDAYGVPASWKNLGVYDLDAAPFHGSPHPPLSSGDSTDASTDTAQKRSILDDQTAVSVVTLMGKVEKISPSRVVRIDTPRYDASTNYGLQILAKNGVDLITMPSLCDAENPDDLQYLIPTIGLSGKVSGGYFYIRVPYYA